jgi:hypothetical protein
MRHASYPAAATAPHEAAVRRHKPARSSLFASLLEALHDSRRAQVRRVLRQYRHLIAQPGERSRHHLITNIGGPENADQ